MITLLSKGNEAFNSNYYDVCICGAGAAGITLAKELAEQGKKVALLEGGGKEYSQESQDIYKGSSTGLEYYLDLWRLRFLGGTTNHWAGRCRPFEKEDFSPKDYDGMPGWPIAFSEMDSYLPGAKEILGLPAENTFQATESSKIESKEFEADKYFVSDPVRFGQKYYSLLSESDAIDVYLNANVTDIKLDESLENVSSVTVSTYDDAKYKVKANKFILCMGAIETARLMLNSNSQIPEGIGNKTDMVGRCFMEHFNIDLGEFVAENYMWKDFKFMQLFTKPDYVKANNLAMASVAFSKLSSYKAYGRTAELKRIFNDLSCRFGVSEHLQFLYEHKCLGEGVIGTICEQFPYKESRLTLNNQKDKFGMRRVTLNWLMSPSNSKAIRTVAIEMAKEFARLKLGRIKLKPYILDSNVDIPAGAHAHQMGTTRMAAEYEYGVVNEDCRVFDVNNLYIAGSGVFATGGAGNPTMPLIQLALRLAEHLNKGV